MLFSVSFKNISFYWRHHYQWSAAKFRPFWGACGFNLEQEGSLQSHTCYDTRPPFMWSYPRKEIPRLVGTNNKPRVMRTYMYSLPETPFNYFKWRTKSFSKGDTENTLSRLKIFWGIAKSIQWNTENAYVHVFPFKLEAFDNEWFMYADCFPTHSCKIINHFAQFC